MKTRTGEAARRERAKHRVRERERSAESNSLRERAAPRLPVRTPCCNPNGWVTTLRERDSNRQRGRAKWGKTKGGEASPGKDNTSAFAALRLAHFTCHQLSLSLCLSHPVSLSLPLCELLSVSLSHPLSLSLWPAQTSRYLMPTSSHRRAQSVVVDRNERYVSFLLLYSKVGTVYSVKTWGPINQTSTFVLRLFAVRARFCFWCNQRPKRIFVWTPLAFAPARRLTSSTVIDSAPGHARRVLRLVNG